MTNARFAAGKDRHGKVERCVADGKVADVGLGRVEWNVKNYDENYRLRPNKKSEVCLRQAPMTIGHFFITLLPRVSSVLSHPHQSNSIKVTVSKHLPCTPQRPIFDPCTDLYCVSCRIDRCPPPHRLNGVSAPHSR